MQRSETSIKTTHSGRLPPVGTGSPPSTNGADGAALVGQVAEVIRKQARLGIDCVGDGEFWNGRNFQYYAQQFAG